MKAPPVVGGALVASLRRGRYLNITHFTLKVNEFRVIFTVGCGFLYMLLVYFRYLYGYQSARKAANAS